MASIPVVIAQVSSAQPARQPGAGASASSSARPAPPASSSSAGRAPASASAQAPAAVSAELMVLHANNSGAGIDPKIRDLPQLKKPPFSSYNSYRVLSQTKLSLSSARTVEAPLPNGGQVKLALKESVPPSRFKLSASILQPNGQPFLPMLEVTLPLNEPFFVGAQSYKDGNRDGKLVLAIKLLK